MICAFRETAEKSAEIDHQATPRSTFVASDRGTRAGDLEIIREGQNLDLGHRTGGEVRQGAK
jgi:hypothetical protein